MVACLGLAIGAWLFGYTPMYTVAAGGVAAVIVWRHRENVKRLASGTEHRLGQRAAGA
jgi:glycerol-3-phosphate acyltransferase PlsY